ncbi:Flp family type IVb pilin [Aurantiacibacter gilvus]|uniref:Flp family type IVb pilin n=1 Tax=Aurantiacibacter gilvus TaxID=3139141 RepID=A0ABU9ICC6_9SPHN
MKKLLHDTRGATAIEYGLIVSLIVIAIITAMQSFANSSDNMWGIIEDKYEQSNNS